MSSKARSTRTTAKHGQGKAGLVPGFVYVRSLAGIDEYVLSKNGLRVLLKRDAFAPVATVMVTYMVGSVDEKSGQTGLAHMVEHMMFKESANFRRKDKRDINELLDKKGARLNASTWLDRTNYFETVATPFLEDAIALEADRMRHAIFDARELASEMTVVRNEYEIGQNDPTRVLFYEMIGAAFQVHPYHHPTIGWLSDIKAYTAEKLISFYDTYYHPDNAVVSVVGDVDIAATLRLIKKHFGIHPKSPHTIPAVTDEEPEQTGERRISINRPGTYDLSSIVWKKPPATHKDIPALLVLANMLGGGEASVLHRVLVDAGHVVDVDVDAFPHRYASVFEVSATLTQGTTHTDVEGIVLRAINDIQHAAVSDEEVARARQRLFAAYEREMTSTMSLSGLLAESIAAGDWTLALMLPKRIAKVSRDDVIRVARMYLTEATRTVGVYHGQQ